MSKYISMKDSALHQKGKKFWLSEYKQGKHFSLSDKPASELIRFCKWFRKNETHRNIEELFFLDVGCGNGRNSIYLAEEYSMRGFGFDYSIPAVESAQQRAKQLNLPVDFFVYDLSQGTLPVKSESIDLVVDSMVMHCLKKNERIQYRSEILRVLRDEGYVFMKTFLREGDENAKRMITEHYGGEEGSYIHPLIGIYEYTWTENGFIDFWIEDFEILVLHKSHGYQRWGGQPYKRRYLYAYLRKRKV